MTPPIQQMFLGAGSAQVTGQDEYTTPGTYQWTAPDGVESVSVVMVGGGGGGAEEAKVVAVVD